MFIKMMLVFAGLIFTIGILIVLGLYPIDRRIPKEHPLNRRKGIILCLLAMGMIFPQLEKLFPHHSKLTILTAIIGFLIIIASVWLLVGLKKEEKGYLSKQ